MIKVIRNRDDSNSKVLKKFSLRSRKANVTKRVQKSKFFTKPLSKKRKKQKAMMRIKYQKMLDLAQKTGKKLSNLLSV